MASKPNRYQQIIERIFFAHYRAGVDEITFQREEIDHAAKKLGIVLPKNVGDLVYSFRYRAALPESIRAKAPAGKSWVIRPAGRSRYRFVATEVTEISPNSLMSETKIPDSTPGIIEMYALTDEQALLAKLRYNRLIDIFTGVTCYSLQSHLRTSVPEVGQVETDEVYVGIDRRGAHFVIPVQAKGGNDRLSIVQIEQDFAMCLGKFKGVICQPVAAQFLPNNVIALFAFEMGETGVAVVFERHYRLVPPEQLTEDELAVYRTRTPHE